MSNKRVVITGMGWITPLGHELEEVWAALLAGKSAFGPVTRYDARAMPTNFAAEVKDFDIGKFFEDTSYLTTTGTSTRYALAAASMAWAQSGMAKAAETGAVNTNDVGVYLGAGEGSLDFENFVQANLAGWNPADRSVNARTWADIALKGMEAHREVEQEPNITVAYVAEMLGCRGPSFNCMTACAAGTQAVGEAFEIIRRGDAVAMLAGGTHTMIHPLGMSGFIRLTAMSQRRETPGTAARPFDLTRDGFVMGEGAGILVLEELEHAQRRGVEILAEVTGYGASADAFRITDIQPQGKGAMTAMSHALRQAGINPREPDAQGRPPVQYISAHGTGTKENDKIETLAVKGVFGPMAPRVPFSSIKSMMGHLIQAAGAVELMTCVMAIKTGWVPPTMNLHNPDPECDLDYVPNKARDMNPSGGVDVCLSNSFGFGGQNNTLVVRRYVG